MLKYGKTAQNAIMAISHLAEVYDGGTTRLSSRDIARNRNLPQPIVAKLLVNLSQAGLVQGAPGPKGGYWLAKNPAEISLYEIVSTFEKVGDTLSCPFGTGACDASVPCPLHHKLLELDKQLVDFLNESKLDAFSKHLPRQPVF
ncbi:Rrf2 family transcriptional regulator [Pelagicoccus sp. NFK12]|uniref:Rrf2 family transcriptional regulator n=1 Tax=Pelagicoccus enzymogenes TaxID=2773457 RepID=A0A927F9A5_9BACT|nr:Rrf2 family transcriptional regulator [Pelagicoccus enzymogenes]MBD5780857.1 Rrf2 family transcriptional regulator [Pelagicoccus enzymogenes]MDQ8199891.1 Rrf2 family transcriptional regulator [Pelagicoccus enzymogenes]